MEFEYSFKSIHAHNVTLDKMCTLLLYNKLPSPLRETLRKELEDNWMDLNEFMGAYYEEICYLECSAAD